ncbi:unnamed protein product [Brassicogethes aeneus]|uniref:UDP-glucuronosyltransferase n=1 Tax=Brassicogethes aeneus TaxID=1431903 RepID=A0A9P0F9A6_BRAAE|nr:unnamed protein product [Brassicogethes aeneus]
MKYLHLVFFLLSVTNFGMCAKILAIFPFPTYSHYILGSKIMKKMAERGHEITIISYFKENSVVKNWKEIVLYEDQDRRESMIKSEFTQKKSFFKNTLDVFLVNTLFSELIFKNTEVQKIFKNTYDLVVYDKFLSQIYTALGYHFKCPVVCITTVYANIFINFLVENPHYTSITPNVHSDLTSYMNLWERFINFIYDSIFMGLMHLYSIPTENKILQETLGPMPHLKKLINNVDLFLLNSHHSLCPNIPLAPSMKEIGGVHISPPKKLPSEIQDYLDNSENGVVYFSMGSILESYLLPNKVLLAFQTFFANISQNVLWKFKGNVGNISKNVKVMEWIPQQDVLAHKNTKVFISHCGAMSMIESVYHGCPIICIPIFADQFINAEYGSFNKYAIRLRFNKLDALDLQNALKNILDNPIYKEKAKHHSKLLLDNPKKPMDTALFWLEYVIKHKGLPYTKSNALNLNWYQKNYLDLIIFLFFILCFLYYVFKVICKGIQQILNFVLIYFLYVL